MKRTILYGCLVALAVAAGSLTAATEQQADVLLQAALAKQTIQGDLRGAIALYEKAVTEAGANRVLAARALVHMAECYQKLGDTQARTIYERVVREYPEQTAAVTLARTRHWAPTHADCRHGRSGPATAWMHRAGRHQMADTCPLRTG
jgi:tetratricopeptide (TPR) repeat protein